MQGSDVSNIMPSPSRCFSNDYFNSGWAQRPKHGKIKGQSYITEDHKETINDFFEAGEKDKRMKISKILILEAMRTALE